MGWIRVSEGVPKDDSIVIVYDGYSVWYGYYDSETGKWDDDNFSSDMAVTHWMPFPDKPQD